MWKWQTSSTPWCRICWWQIALVAENFNLRWHNSRPIVRKGEKPALRTHLTVFLFGKHVLQTVQKERIVTKRLKFLLLCLWIFCSHAEIEKLRKFVGNRSSRTNLPFVINAFAACKLLFSLSQALTEVRSQYAYAGIKCAWMLPQDEANITKLDNFRFKTLKLIANMLGSQEDLLDCWKEYKWSNAGLLKLFCSATPFQKRFF